MIYNIKYHNKMAFYIHGKIYALRSNQTEKVYIGSTTKRYLSSRLAEHKGDYKRFASVSSREITKYPDCYIELLESYPCDTRKELNRREAEIIRATDHTVNKYLT